ncbi:hypothetical protein NMG60_11011814 [Bertholletia excelsa]
METKCVISDVVQVMTKITKHKFNDSNYLEWSKTVCIYIRSINKHKNRIKISCLIPWSSKEIMKNLMLPLSPDVKVQQTQRKQMAMTSFLAGLPPKYDTVKSHILSGSEISSLHDTFTRVLSTKSSQSTHPTTMLLSITMAMDDKSNQENRGKNGNKVSYYCQELGHTKHTWRKLQNKSQCTQMANMTTKESTVSPSLEKTILVYAEEYAQFSQYQAPLKSTQSPITAFAESGNSTSCLVSSSSKWIIDSRITNHMTGNSSLLTNLQPHTTFSFVTLTNESKSSIMS